MGACLQGLFFVVIPVPTQRDIAYARIRAIRDAVYPPGIWATHETQQQTLTRGIRLECRSLYDGHWALMKDNVNEICRSSSACKIADLLREYTAFLERFGGEWPSSSAKPQELKELKELKAYVHFSHPRPRFLERRIIIDHVRIVDTTILVSGPGSFVVRHKQTLK